MNIRYLANSEDAVLYYFGTGGQSRISAKFDFTIIASTMSCHGIPMAAECTGRYNKRSKLRCGDIATVVDLEGIYNPISFG